MEYTNNKGANPTYPVKKLKKYGVGSAMIGVISVAMFQDKMVSAQEEVASFSENEETNEVVSSHDLTETKYLIIAEEPIPFNVPDVQPHELESEVALAPSEELVEASSADVTHTEPTVETQPEVVEVDAEPVVAETLEVAETTEEISSVASVDLDPVTETVPSKESADLDEPVAEIPSVDSTGLEETVVEPPATESTDLQPPVNESPAVDTTNPGVSSITTYEVVYKNYGTDDIVSTEHFEMETSGTDADTIEVKGNAPAGYVLSTDWLPTVKIRLYSNQLNSVVFSVVKEELAPQVNRPSGVTPAPWVSYEVFYKVEDTEEIVSTEKFQVYMASNEYGLPVSVYPTVPAGYVLSKNQRDTVTLHPFPHQQNRAGFLVAKATVTTGPDSDVPNVDTSIIDTPNGGTQNGGTQNGGTSNGGTSNGGTPNGGTQNGGPSNGGTQNGSTLNGVQNDGSTGGNGTPRVPTNTPGANVPAPNHVSNDDASNTVAPDVTPNPVITVPTNDRPTVQPSNPATHSNAQNSPSTQATNANENLGTTSETPSTRNLWPNADRTASNLAQSQRVTTTSDQENSDKQNTAFTTTEQKESGNAEATSATLDSKNTSETNQISATVAQNAANASETTSPSAQEVTESNNDDQTASTGTSSPTQQVTTHKPVNQPARTTEDASGFSFLNAAAFAIVGIGTLVAFAMAKLEDE